MTYCCNGAVSGAWWGGNYQETKPGYAIIDLYPDGRFTNHVFTPYAIKPGPYLLIAAGFEAAWTYSLRKLKVSA